MAQMFRVGDLAAQMGVTEDALIFKLRSIGVDVKDANDMLDLATVRDIITGQTLLRRPREVIVRKEAGAAVDERRRPQQEAIERVKRRRPSRRFGAEDMPDAVPDLSSLTSAAQHAVDDGVEAGDDTELEAVGEHLAETGEVVETGQVEEAVETAAETAAEEAGSTAATEAAGAAAADEAAETPEAAAVEPVGEAEEAAPAETEPAPAKRKKSTRAKAEAEEETPAAEAASPEEPAAEAHEAPADKPARAKTAKAAEKPAAKPAAPAKKGAKTPLESQLRELSDEEVRQRIMAAKQAAAKKATEKAAPSRGKSSRKAKAAADADEIRDLLAKFEESKVRASTEAPTPPPRSQGPAGRGRPQRIRRTRAEAPTTPREIKLEFRGGKPEGPIYLSEAVTVRELAEKLDVLVKDLMAYLISKKILVVANQVLPQDLAEKICEELGLEAMAVSFEEEIDLQQEETAEAVGTPELRPPVVTVMGHVDHGKTSLLDAIRSTRVAVGEAGGITQHIGASRVVHNDKPIVFIDTPGHEAFTQMRARGAKVTDIVVLVVAADDGVMPQTIEAINHARAAHVPVIVAINKIDKANANVDRVKQELSGQGILLEGWGGDVPAVEVSALKKKGIDELLEVIQLLAEMESLKAVPEGPARGAVLEARKEKGRGVVATVLIQQGTLSQGDSFFAGATYGRVRAMLDTNRKPVKEALPTDAVEIMGFEDIPDAGDTFQVVENEARAREVATHRKARQREEQHAATRKVSLEGIMDQIRAEDVKALNIVLKADVQGSVEVLRDTLAKLATDEVSINILHASVGGITANDILLASASQAIVIGFNVRPDRSAKELSERERVDVRLYSVIYDLTEDIQKAMSGLLAPTFREEELGRAEIREVFRIPKVGSVAGCMVTDGAIPRNAKVRLVRDSVVVWEGQISTLRRFKEDVSEVRTGFECGISLERYQDIKQGDVIEAYRSVEVAREV